MWIIWILIGRFSETGIFSYTHSKIRVVRTVPTLVSPIFVPDGFGPALPVPPKFTALGSWEDGDGYATLDISQGSYERVSGIHPGSGVPGSSMSPVSRLVPILVYPALYQSWYNFPAPPRSRIRSVQHVPSRGVRGTCTGFWRDLRSPQELYQLWYIHASAEARGCLPGMPPRGGDMHCASGGVRRPAQAFIPKLVQAACTKIGITPPASRSRAPDVQHVPDP